MNLQHVNNTQQKQKFYKNRQLLYLQSIFYVSFKFYNHCCNNYSLDAELFTTKAKVMHSSMSLILRTPTSNNHQWQLLTDVRSWSGINCEVEATRENNIWELFSNVICIKQRLQCLNMSNNSAVHKNPSKRVMYFFDGSKCHIHT